MFAVSGLASPSSSWLACALAFLDGVPSYLWFLSSSWRWFFCLSGFGDAAALARGSIAKLAWKFMLPMALLICRGRRGHFTSVWNVAAPSSGAGCCGAAMIAVLTSGWVAA